MVSPILDRKVSELVVVVEVTTPGRSGSWEQALWGHPLHTVGYWGDLLEM